jgi:RNA ligase
MEGVVVRLLGSGVRVKIKEEAYVALHRLVTGMNARAIWERLGAGETADAICSAIPEEFWPWVKEVAAELEEQRDSILLQARREHMLTELRLPDGWTRKDYALAVENSEVRPWLFLLLDGKDPLPKIWYTLRPSAERSLTACSEDAA